MPGSRATVVMLHGRGGHLSTMEYSIILVRSAKGWRGTAVGRSRIRAKGAPWQPMTRTEWALDGPTGRALDAATPALALVGEAPQRPTACRSRRR